jgi:hypothetical protein
MRVTVREDERSDRVLMDFTVIPHLGLPFPGDRIDLPRRPYQSRANQGTVIRYEWKMATESPVLVEVWMLVHVDN